ncbi:MAG TPA: YpdA family putative bacillithiol disulfide reductase [Gemmatimonadaceae bacterium]|nr:YpdA family putative bacillithiol disulfide reductase [Gemmatimonadaceae bacterium]
MTVGADVAVELDAVIIGAGPCGLAAAIAFKRAGLRAVVIDRSCIVSGVASYPTYITFFSTPDRLSIGDVPFIVATEKPTRRDALAYYRAVTTMFDLDVRQYENVERVTRCDGVFVVESRTRHGALRETRARAVVVATGYFGHPNRLHVPGEDLPHVTHQFTEGHWAFRQDVVVVGGGNSAVEAALDLYRSGARVTVVHFGPQLDPNIKPWVLPDITNRIKEGSIGARFGSRVRAITPEHVELDTPNGVDRVRADHVFLMVGYQPNAEVLVQLEVPIDPRTGIPAHDPATMETAVPGVFIAGVIASGNDANKTFIENGRFHGDLIARRLAADAPGRPRRSA